MEISLDYKDGLKFSGHSTWGHEITTDGSKKAGGAEEGYQPAELMLFALAGCTGIDIVNIGRKMRLDIKDVNIKIIGEQDEKPPRPFTNVHVIYTVIGRDIDPKKLERVIDLGMNGYCTVAATMKGIAKISHEYKIIEENLIHDETSNLR